MGITIWLAFIGGLLSFLSPCILPVAPGYLGMLSGTSFANMQAGFFSRRRMLMITAAFVLGFSAVFIGLGLASSLLGQWLLIYRAVLARIGGVAVIFLGLHQAGWLPLGWLYRERRVSYHGSPDLWGAFITGLAFSLGWTPCVGPILGAILTLAGNTANTIRGFWLLVFYSLGLAIPFLMLALAFEQVSGGLSKVKPYLKYLQWSAGLLMILMGLLLFTGSLAEISVWFIRFTGGWNPENWLRR